MPSGGSGSSGCFKTPRVRSDENSPPGAPVKKTAAAQHKHEDANADANLKAILPRKILAAIDGAGATRSSPRTPFGL